MSLDHPLKTQLVAFGQGKLNDDESLVIEQHLASCHECCETLLDLKDDTFVGLVKIAQSSDSDRRMGTPARLNSDRVARSEPQAKGVAAGSSTSATSHALPDVQGMPPNVGMSKSAHSTDAATVLVQSGEPISSDELPSELIDHPRYRIVEIIGRGGMGNVYRAEHRLMNRPVAIKLINAQLVRHPLAVERFRREVQAAAKLSHPNIVAAYDAEQAGDVHFLVMEFVEGTDLASYVAERGPMSVSDACDCIRQAAAGLQHAAEKGMVHRDIKPQNLMLTPSGQVRILDFGLAGFACSDPIDRVEPDTSGDDRMNAVTTNAGHLTLAGSVMGTPDYMAPEQAADAHAADIRADLYSLGCTLFFLLTGKPPFEAANVVEKLKAHAQQEPPTLIERRADVSQELQHVVSRLLAKRPEDRFQTPAEVVAALSSVTLEPTTQSQFKKSQRLGLLIAAICCGITVLLGGVIVAITSKGRLEIHSEVDDVQVAVTKGGQQIEILDLKTGSQMKWLPNGDYELKVVGRDNDVMLDKSGFSLSRFGQAIVTVRWKLEGFKVIKSFTTTDKLITQEGVSVDDGSWKITAKETRSVRLFEIPDPNFDSGPFFFRAKLKTENVTGRAYLEMWNRAPGQGEFFSKGFHNAVTGTTGWAEYEIPFFLKKGEQVDLVKLNVTIEGSGTVWIKDIEVRGRQRESHDKPTDDAASKAVVSKAASQNLLTDPSFENTPITQLPTGWRAWLNDGQEFRCEVVAGGHTGQRCLQIKGKGTRGVVFGNDLKVDRTKRYTLKGWAKFEGDKDARAVIKFNYFRGSEFLGVHDLVGATADQPGWHLFEKTDALDAYPQADHFYVMCHVEGSGTGWFDDLELIAYDRDKLPNDFDARHGRHNRLHGPNSLRRWVGIWNTNYTFRETDNSPQETTLAMTTVSEQMLGDFFLMSHSQAKAPATEERLQFQSFDQNLGAFRQWLFSSNGKSFEWRGPWNQDQQTLELRMLPDASNLFSAERFVDAEHVEGTLWQQFVMGQRDAGRWSATRQTAIGKVDVPVAKTHVAEPIELSQLNKFAGEWTIRVKSKPTVWSPNGGEETLTEKVSWILGGRFLMARAFNAKDELTSIWIATYAPREKSNRFWFFNGDGSTGEWRVTWDAATATFHWRASDMPEGWIGTGSNHLINDDTFECQALIKDENGRVLLDLTQDKRRKK